MNDVDEIQFEAEEIEESLEGEVLQGERTIRTNSADPEIESLHGKWKRGCLILQPFFQRQYVWDGAKASRLIESALCSFTYRLSGRGTGQHRVGY